MLKNRVYYLRDGYKLFRITTKKDLSEIESVEATPYTAEADQQISAELSLATEHRAIFPRESWRGMRVVQLELSS